MRIKKKNNKNNKNNNNKKLQSDGSTRNHKRRKEHNIPIRIRRTQTPENGPNEVREMRASNSMGLRSTSTVVKKVASARVMKNQNNYWNCIRHSIENRSMHRQYTPVNCVSFLVFALSSNRKTLALAFTSHVARRKPRPASPWS